MGARLVELTAALGVAPPPGSEDVAVRDVCGDSRQVGPGALYVAIRGAVHDGADYIDEAIDRGAVAVVSEADLRIAIPHVRVVDARVALAELAAVLHGRPTGQLFTVGVTGTNGKTTVCHWLAHLLGLDRTVVIGTVANEARGLRAVTTPPSPVVQRIAAEARDGGAANLIVEASSIGLAHRRLDAIDFDVAVFTNLSHDHLDLHGSPAAYLKAKRILFDGLRETACAVVNADDPASESILVGCRAGVVRYGLAPDVDLRAIGPEAAPRATRCTLAWRGGTAPLDLPHPGVHNLSNALAAAAVLLAGGGRLSDVTERLRSAPVVDGRLQRFSRSDGAVAVVDFAHSPDALRRALETVRPRAGRLTVVFGCPGGADREKRPIMGEIAGRLADRAFVTADNPKHEDPERILDEIEAGLRRCGGRWERVVDRREAVARAVGAAGPDDVVLLAGKGHESYQIVGDEFVPYSDRSVLEALGFTLLP